MNLVRGTGPDSSNLMIVADYPHKDDISQGFALSGKPGWLVEQLLRSYKIRLDNTYRTLLFKTAIDEKELKNRRSRYKYIEELLRSSDSIEILRNEIEAIRPNVILALGEAALFALANEKGIDNFRGSILPISPLFLKDSNIKVVPTFHPRQVWERYEMLPIVRLDYGKAISIQHDSSPIKYNERIWICRNAAQLNSYWQRAQQGEFLVFDIETLYGILFCISFCADGVEAVSVPLADSDIPVLDLALMWKMVAKIMRHPIHKVNQNLAFDMSELEDFGFEFHPSCVTEEIDDTMLLFHSMYPEFPKNLGFLTSIYTNFPYHKDEGHDFNPRVNHIDQFYIYNAKDSLVTWNILKAQKQDLQEFPVKPRYEQTKKLFHTYRKINRRGIRIDEERRKQLREKYEMLYTIRYANILNIYGKNINLQSPKQVAELVYDFLKCPPHYHTTDDGVKALSTDKETLEEIYLNEVSDPVIKQILQQIIVCRKVLTILGYVNVLSHPDGRLRTTYDLAGTKSGRTSGHPSLNRIYYITKDGKLDYRNLGCSLQVLPKRSFECEELEGEIFGADIPSMFIPSPGYVFVEGDGKAAEAGVVCVLSEDYDTLHYMYERKTTKVNQYGCADDIHVLTAMWTTNKEFEDITDFDRETYGKRPRHAGNYDMTPYRLSMMIHKAIKDCEIILTRFHLRSPKIRAIFHAQVKDLVTNTGTLLTPHYRNREFFGRRSNEQFKEAYSYIPQATVSDHTKDTMLLLEPEFPDTFFLVEKHDSILAEVPIDQKEKYAEAFKRHYERLIDFSVGSLPREFKLRIPAEIKWSDTNWGDMRKLKI